MIAVWRIKKTFVPLGTSNPQKELKYFISDSNIGAILHSSNYIKNKNLFKSNEIQNAFYSDKEDDINNSGKKNINDGRKEEILGVNIANLRIPLFDLSHSTLQSELLSDSDFDSVSDNLLHEDDHNNNERKKLTLNNNNNNNGDYNKNNNIDNDDTNNSNKDKNNDDRNNDINENNDINRNSVKTSDALILYTSGTTGRPKGVAHTRHVITKIQIFLLTRNYYFLFTFFIFLICFTLILSYSISPYFMSSDLSSVFSLISNIEASSHASFHTLFLFIP